MLKSSSSWLQYYEMGPWEGYEITEAEGYRGHHRKGISAFKEILELFHPISPRKSIGRRHYLLKSKCGLSRQYFDAGIPNLQKCEKQITVVYNLPNSMWSKLMPTVPYISSSAF